jgi:hypothetical protein
MSQGSGSGKKKTKSDLERDIDDLKRQLEQAQQGHGSQRSSEQHLPYIYETFTRTQ